MKREGGGVDEAKVGRYTRWRDGEQTRTTKVFVERRRGSVDDYHNQEVQNFVARRGLARVGERSGPSVSTVAPSRRTRARTRQPQM